jgi:hypothetical protein
VAYLLIHFTERDADSDHADLLMPGIKYRCKHAQRLGENAMVDRDILPAMQGRDQIITNKVFTDFTDVAMG